MTCIVELQQACFYEAGKQLNNNNATEKQVTIGYMYAPAVQDLLDLRDKELLCWDVALKGSVHTSSVHNLEHLIKGVVYYGDSINGRLCLGYFIGSYNTENQIIEIDFIERRNDEVEGFDNSFIAITLTALALYAAYIEMKMELEVMGIAFVSPIESSISKFKKHGFTLKPDYRKGVEAMIKFSNK